MTRFARAKGSKASNERLPEEPTPWGEMKKQLLEKNAENEENKKRKNAFDQRHLNYKAFLEEMEQKELEGSRWAEFPGKTPNKKSTHKKTNSDVSRELNENSFHGQSSIIKKKKNKCKKTVSDSVVSGISDLTLNNTTGTKNENKTKKVMKEKSTKSQKVLVSKKNKLKDGTNKRSNSVVNSTESEINCSKTVEKVTKVKSKKLKGKIVSNLENSLRESTSAVKEKKSKLKTNEISIDSESNTSKNANKTKKRKLNETNGLSEQVKPPKIKKIAKDKKHIELELSNLTEENLKNIEKKRQRKIKQLEKRKHFKEISKAQNHSQLAESNPTISSDNKGVFNNSNSSNNKYNKKIKEKKFKNRNEHQRRKPLTEKMFINGKEIDIAYVDGFPVKKEDADRLKKLRKDMINKGLPRSEINIAMKLERRRAEKAFAREKKKVCFNCRKSGHNLSECPELEKNEIAPTAGSGICFKCGSTEHTHFQCKVVKGQEFKFAQCFICNEQGHIARQCPDNARGLYPKGGACKVCGDVTHLKKDCPQYQAQQQHLENTLDVETLGNDNPDIIGEGRSIGRSLQKQKPNKIIKFA